MVLLFFLSNYLFRRDLNYFILFFNRTTTAGAISDGYYFKLDFYSGGGIVQQIENSKLVLLNDGNFAVKLFNVANGQIISSLK